MITNFGFGQLPPQLLDDYPGAVFAVSLRRISRAYTGAAVRVRRSSDNAEQDIGFKNFAFDTASFSSFVGGGSGYIVTFYDQSGNGNDFTQSTAASQYQLVLTSDLTTKPNIVATTTTGGYTTSGVTLHNNALVVVSTQRNTTNNYGTLFCSVEENPAPGYYETSYLAVFPVEGRLAWANGAGQLFLSLSPSGTLNTNLSLAGDFDTAVKKIYKNGSLNNSISNTTTTSFTPQIGGATYFPLAGYWAELIVFDAAKDDDFITDIQDNQVAYYGI